MILDDLKRVKVMAKNYVQLSPLLIQYDIHCNSFKLLYDADVKDGEVLTALPLHQLEGLVKTVYSVRAW